MKPYEPFYSTTNVFSSLARVERRKPKWLNQIIFFLRFLFFFISTVDDHVNRTLCPQQQVKCVVRSFGMMMLHALFTKIYSQTQQCGTNMLYSCCVPLLKPVAFLLPSQPLTCACRLLFWKRRKIVMQAVLMLYNNAAVLYFCSFSPKSLHCI